MALPKDFSSLKTFFASFQAFPYFLLVLILLQGTFCYSQKTIIPERNSFNGRFVRYDLPVGGNQAATCFFQDKKGFIWIGTYQGLFRFDGTEFLQIGKSKVNDSTGFAGKLVSSMVEDSHGRIWFGTSGGLNCYDPSTGWFRYYCPDTTDISSNNNKIQELIIDRSGTLWLMSLKDVFSFSPVLKSFTRFKLDSIGRKNEEIPFFRSQGRILEDLSGNIWFASSHGLAMVDKTMGKLISFHSIPSDPTSISSNSISGICMDGSGNIFVSTTDKGLNRIIDQGNGIFRKIRLPLDNKKSNQLDSISVILTDNEDGSVWAFGNLVFGKYIPSTGEFKYYRFPQPSKIEGINRPALRNLTFQFAFKNGSDEIIAVSEGPGLVLRFNKRNESALIYPTPNYSVFHSIVDQDGSMWFSCPYDRVFQLLIKPLDFSYVDLPHDSRRQSYNQQRIAQDATGRLWFTLFTGIFTSDIPDRNKYFKLKKYKFPDNYEKASSVFKDSGGKLWFTRKDGKIASVDPLNGKMKIFPYSSLFKGEINIIKEDNHHNIWLTGGGAFFRIDSGTSKIRKSDFKGEELRKALYDEGVYDFYIDRRERMWLGLRSNRLLFVNMKSNTIETVAIPDEMNLRYGDVCIKISEDSKGNIYFLYVAEGLFVIDQDALKIKHIDLYHDADQNAYLNMIIDRKDNIWITDLNGTTIFNPHNFSSKRLKIKQSDSNIFTFQLNNGDILLHNEEKLMLLEDTIHTNIVPPKVYITSIKINNTDYNRLYPGTGDVRELDQISLKFNENNIRLFFSGLSYPEAVYGSYKYIMNGIDNDTVNTTSSLRFAEYKKLKTGKYRFWVNSSNSDGLWNPTGRSIEITILPPWYGTPAAYITYSLIVIIILYGFITLRLWGLRSDKRKLEEEVRLRTSELEAKNEQILELDKVKTRFFTEISHEIRTPLSLISGPIENLIREYDRIDEEKRLKWMEMIKRNSRRLLKLVNQLLDISRLDAGKMKITLVEADVLNCLRILSNEYLSLAESRKIRYVIDIANNDYITYFDRDKIEKILSNLLSNAFKFTPSFGMVSCKVKIIKSTENKSPAILSILVHDNGIGISNENIDKIFDRFYRVEGQWEKDGTGTGIGLSLTYEFVTLLHGEIKVTSEPGFGSLFEVSIPVGREHLKKSEYVILEVREEDMDFNHLPDEPYFSSDEREFNNGEKDMSLLVIEDNYDLKQFLADHLAKDYHVFVAENGKTGLALALSKIPDIIITDRILPDLEGLEICSVLKNDERTSHIPIIMLTAKTTQEDKIEGLKSGADEYLFKPFDITELKVRISNLILTREKLRLKYGILTGFELKDKHASSLDDNFMARIGAIINENLKDFDFDVGALQEKVGMSRVHLYRKIKAITGLSPSILIRNFRMKRAAEMVSQQHMSLTKIALNVGFTNPSYFSKCFREYYGVSPKDYFDQESKNT